MSDAGARANIIEKLVSNAQTAASRLRVRSALNPMLWLSGIISPVAFLFGYLFRGVEPICTIFVCIGAAPIAATIGGFFYFMIVAPEKLQSEEFQLRQQSLEIIKQKGSSIELSPSSLEAIANPAYSPVREIGR